MHGKKRNRIILGLAIYLCISAFFPISATAKQAPVFRIDMNRLNLQKGVSDNVVVSLENAQGAQILNIEGLEEFDVLSQSQSTSTSMINGETTYRVDLHYSIMPKTAGQFTLKANIRYDGQNYETNALQVTVSEGPPAANESARELFIQTVVSHTEAFLGEKIVVTYELYSRYNIENFGFTDTIAIDGVITKEIPNNQLKAEYVYIDGERYAMYEARQLIIDPIKTGICIIPSYNFQVNVTTNSSGFFSSYTPMYLQTEEQELTINPLPTEGRPGDFSGIVGELQLDGSYSREVMNYGDSFALYATASGNCNLDGLKNIINQEMPGLSVYETQKNMTESVENNQYYAQKSFEVILVPEKTGVIDVAPISVSYFNPVTKQYEKAEIPGVTIEVLGDMPQPNHFSGSLPGNIDTVTINQVNYASANDGYFTVQIKKEWVYGMLIIFAVCMVLVAVLVWWLSNRKKQNQQLKSLYKQLMAAKDINEIYDLFNTMIKHCYKLSLKASSQNRIRSSLQDPVLAEQITEIMEYMESAENHGEKGPAYLKDKIRGVNISKFPTYRLFSKRQ